MISLFFFSNIYLAYQLGCSCKNGGRCVMNYGSYGCECPYGYTGINCETCMKSFIFFLKNFDFNMYYLVTGLVPEELLPLLLKEAAVENAEEGRKILRKKIVFFFVVGEKDYF